MHTMEQAQAEMLKVIAPLPTETVSLAQAAGRVLAGEALSAVDLPRFDNSAMDGYAVRAIDAGKGAKLRYIGKVPAGCSFDNEVGAGECVRIFTGSPMPAGANAVVMQEDTRVDGSTVEITDGVKPFEHVRLRGEDVKAGECIGQALSLIHI